MRLNDTEKEATPFTANAQPPAAHSTRVAQELAAGKRNGGRPSPGWVGPRWKTKNDGQPENHQHKRDGALRMSRSLKKSGKKKARGKQTAPNCRFHGDSTQPPKIKTVGRRRRNFSKMQHVCGCIGTELCKKIRTLQQFSESTRLSSPKLRCNIKGRKSNIESERCTFTQKMESDEGQAK